MEPVSLLIGGGLIVVGFLLGRAHRRTPHPVDETKCPGCRHSLSYRDPQTGRCAAEVEVPSQYDEYGSAVAYRRAPCQCRNHVSPNQLLIDATWKPSIEPTPQRARVDTENEK